MDGGENVTVMITEELKEESDDSTSFEVDAYFDTGTRHIAHPLLPEIDPDIIHNICYLHNFCQKSQEELRFEDMFDGEVFVSV